MPKGLKGFQKGHGLLHHQKGKQRPKGMFCKNWKGDLTGKAGMHMWIKTLLGNPMKCSVCGSCNKKTYDWANKDHKYKRNINDYIRMCRSCHRKYDIKNNNYNIDKFKHSTSKKISTSR